MSDPDLTIEFGTPPVSSRGAAGGPSRHAAAAEALRARPGQWARIASWNDGKPDTSLTSAIRKGRRGFAPSGAFDARSTNRDGRYEVWACFVGKAATPAPATPRPAVMPPRPAAAPPSRPTAAPTASIVRDLRKASEDSVLCAACGHAKLRHDGDDAPACGRVGCTCVTYRKPTA